MLSEQSKKSIKKSFLSGKPIMLYDFDNREAETDLIYYGPTTKPQSIKDLRLSAGAPVSVYIDFEMGEKFGIDTFHNFIKNLPEKQHSILKSLIKSDSKIEPRFSITLDYRKNKTGCSHFETARTIRELCALIRDDDYHLFSAKFRSPGHIPLIIASKGLLKERDGHTELIMTLIKSLKLEPIVVASEMIDQKTLRSLSYKKAKEYALKNNLLFISGKQLIN